MRQRPNERPVSLRKARASVRLLAPTVRPHSCSVRGSAGIGEERVGDVPRARVRRRADVDRRDPKRQQQVEEHGLGARALLGSEPAVVEVVDEFAEERADRDRRGHVPVDRAATRFDVDRAQDGGARRARLVHRAGGDPERPRRRQDVAAAALGEDDEHALGRPGELVVAVRVPLEARPDRHRERAHDRRRSRLSVHRHNLAAYSLSETESAR